MEIKEIGDEKKLVKLLCNSFQTIFNFSTFKTFKLKNRVDLRNYYYWQLKQNMHDVKHCNEF